MGKRDIAILGFVGSKREYEPPEPYEPELDQETERLNQALPFLFARRAQ
jgi:hypothetical protein